MKATTRRFDWTLLLGYDIFISYKRGPQASNYSRNLCNALAQQGFQCFLDQEETEGGVELRPALQRAIKRSRLLVVLAEPNVVNSRYVGDEIESFKRNRKGRILPLNVGTFLISDVVPPPFDHLKTLTWLTETESRFELGSPSDQILAGIRLSFRRLRVGAISRAITWTVILVLFAATLAALVQWRSAVQQAEAALAQAYAADLNLSELAHVRRDTRSVVDLLSRYEGRLGRAAFPEFGWLQLWNAYNADERRFNHEPGDLAIGISPDGKTLVTAVRYVSAISAGTLTAWDIATRHPRFKIRLPHLTTVHAVAWAPASDRFATDLSTTDGSQIVVWNPASGEQLRTVTTTGHLTALRFTHDGRSIVAPVTSGADAPFQVWDAASGAARYSNDAKKFDAPQVTAWVLAPDDQTIVLAYDPRRNDENDGGIWDLGTRTLRAPFAYKADNRQVIGGLAYSPDGRVLVTAHGTWVQGGSFGSPGRVRTWDTQSGELLHTDEYKNGAYAVAFSPDGRFLAVASGIPAGWSDSTSELTVRDRATGASVATFDKSQTGLIERLAFSADGLVLATSAADSIVFLVDTATWRKRSELRGHVAAITDLQFAAQDGWLGTASSDGVARLWRPALRSEGAVVDEPTAKIVAAAVSLDGTMVAEGHEDGNVIFKDGTSLRPTGRTVRAPSALRLLAVDGDGRRLAGVTDQAIFIWDVHSGDAPRQLRRTVENIQRLWLDESGRYLTLGLGESRSSFKQLERWDVNELRRTVHHDISLFDDVVAVSPDGRFAAQFSRAQRMGTLRVRDLTKSGAASVAAANVRPLLREPADGVFIGGKIRAAAFSRDGSRLAVAEQALSLGTISVFETATMTVQNELVVEPEEIHALAFGGNNRLASAAYRDGTLVLSANSTINATLNRVRLWDLPGAREYGHFSLDSQPINRATLESQSLLCFTEGSSGILVRERDTLVVTDTETGRMIASSARAPEIRAGGFHAAAPRVVIAQTTEHGGEATLLVRDGLDDAPGSSVPVIPSPEAWSLAFSSDGRRLAVGSERGSVRLYDARSNALEQIVEGLDGVPDAIAFGADGRSLLAAGKRSAIASWALSDGKLTLLIPAASRHGVGLSRDGAVVMTVGADGTLVGTRLSDGAHTFDIRDRIVGPALLAFSPDNTLVAVSRDAADGTLSIFDRASGREVAAMRANRSLTALALGRNGLVAAGASNGGVTVWQLPSLEPLKGPPQPSQYLAKSPIVSLAFDPSATRLAVGRANGQLVVWRESLGELRPIEIESGAREIQAVAFSPDGHTLASADSQGRLVLWDAETDKVTMRAVLNSGHATSVVGVATDRESVAIVDADRAISLRSLPDGTLKSRLLGHTSAITGLAFANARLASASSSEVMLWESDTGRRLNTFPGASPMNISSDGSRVAAMRDPRMVVVWSVRSSRQLASIPNLTEPQAVALSAEGETLAIAESNRISIWDGRGNLLSELTAYQPIDHPIIALSPDGRTLATVGAQGRVELWHTFTGRRLRTLQENSNNALQLVFSPDGSQLLLATRTSTRIWRAVTETQAREHLRLLMPASE